VCLSGVFSPLLKALPTGLMSDATYRGKSPNDKFRSAFPCAAGSRVLVRVFTRVPTRQISTSFGRWTHSLHTTRFLTNILPTISHGPPPYPWFVVVHRISVLRRYMCLSSCPFPDGIPGNLHTYLAHDPASPHRLPTIAHLPSTPTCSQKSLPTSNARPSSFA